MKLWSKGYTIAPLIEQYTAANNAALDVELARHDLWGSLAHVAMLRHIGLLTQSEAMDLQGALCQLLARAERGTLIPGMQQEDIHTVVEQALIEMVQETGKKIHTGRSRNDQVLVDLRLYAKESMLGLMQTLFETATQLLALASAQQWTPLPGYTHMQRAMLSSVGLWASAYAESLLDDSVAIAAAYILNDQSPLGSGAAYGSPLPLDREFTARALGFARPQHNVLAVANARGKNRGCHRRGAIPHHARSEQICAGCVALYDQRIWFRASAPGAVRRQQHDAAKAQPRRAGARTGAGPHRHLAAIANVVNAGGFALRLQHGLPGDESAPDPGVAHLPAKPGDRWSLRATHAVRREPGHARRAVAISSPPIEPTNSYGPACHFAMPT